MLRATVPVLPSLDLDETLRFYAKLGFTEKLRAPEGYSVLERDACEIHFFLKGDHEIASSFFGCYIRVAAVEAMHWQCQQAGISPSEIIPSAQGDLQFGVFDPHGNLLRFGEEP
jgi:catechol 2,3-dioxygenase-like lactoylglutathione lyase family enzyme